MVSPGGSTSILLVAFVLLGACRRKEEPLFKDPPPPPIPVSAPAPAPSVDPKVVAARNAEVQKTKSWLADLKFLLEHKVTTSPQLVSGEGDATSICDAAATARAKGVDAELAPVHEEIAQLCAFDVPLLVANEALDHLRTSTSQASVRLMCTVSAKEIAKARSVKPKDPKVLAAEHRRSASGRCH